MTIGRRRLVLVALAAVALAGVIVAIRDFGYQPAIRYGDNWVYLAAGERLNAGHSLYALVPGDRELLIVPPYWSIPLLAPPPVAVLWRPLAALGPASMDLWGAANLIVTTLTVAFLALRSWRTWTTPEIDDAPPFAGGLIGLATIAILMLPLALLAMSGNVNGFVLAALVAAWDQRDRPAVVGVSLAFAVAMKLTPALFVIWLIGARRFRALAAATIAVGFAGLLSLAGAGVQAHIDWLATAPMAQPSPLAVASLTGLSSSAVGLIAAVIVSVFAWRADERATYSAAAVLAALASPALYFQAIALLVAAIVPWIGGRRGRTVTGGRPTTHPAT
jgi:alpha-1,2-mannosyltransferase